MPVTSNLLLKIRGLTHSFGDRNEPVPTLFKSQWDQSGHLWKQTHGTEMVLVTIPKPKKLLNKTWNQALALPWHPVFSQKNE